MDEITMFTELRPDAGNLEEMRDGARRRFAAGVASGGIGANVGARRLRRVPGMAARRGWQVPVTGAGLTAAAAAAAVLLAGGTGAAPTRHPAAAGHAGTVVTTAWTVRQAADGTVTIEFRQFADLPRLQRVLRHDGINAIARPLKLACSYSHADDAPKAVQQAVLSGPDRTVSPVPASQQAFVIHPAAMPPGSALFLTASFTRDRSVSFTEIGYPMVLNSDKVPACLPVSWPGRGPAR